MSNEQALREALRETLLFCETFSNRWDGETGAHPFDMVERARQALALPTAAPDMPLSMNQFGRLVELTREHLTDNTFVYKATSKAGDTCHFGVESAAKAWAKGGTVEAIKVREFKLHTSGPTADHLPDAGKMIETAAPVGERELPPLPSCARWEERIKTLMQQCGHPNSMSIYQAFKQFQNEFEHEMIAYARAALRAGDAVDAQRYRWLREQHWSNSAICCVYKPKQNVRLGGTCPSGDLLDSAIDAAMRKGQL